MKGMNVITELRRDYPNNRIKDEKGFKGIELVRISMALFDPTPDEEGKSPQGMMQVRFSNEAPISALFTDENLDKFNKDLAPAFKTFCYAMQKAFSQAMARDIANMMEEMKTAKGVH